LGESLGLRPLDCGPLRNAHALEHLAALWIHLALKGGHGRAVAFSLSTRKTAS
jgi:predicted dinucleotide-binding enzyme